MKLARSVVSASALAVLLFASAVAQAASVVEAEVDGTATNNTQATAQVIAGTSFTTTADPTVEGGSGASGTVTGLLTASISGRGANNDVDYFQFTLTSAAANTWFDTDGIGFDTQLFLFDAAGALLALNDDDNNGADEGGLSSFLGDIQNLAAGTYFIAVSQFNNDPTTGGGVTSAVPENANNGFTDNGSLVTGSAAGQGFAGSGTQGGSGYVLHITTNASLSPLVVPEPGTWALFGLGATGLFGAAWRRRRRAPSA